MMHKLDELRQSVDAAFDAFVAQHSVGESPIAKDIKQLLTDLLPYWHHEITSANTQVACEMSNKDVMDIKKMLGRLQHEQFAKDYYKQLLKEALPSVQDKDLSDRIKDVFK